MKRCLFLLIMVLLATPALAVTRYVDNTPPSGCTNGITTYSPTGSGSCGSGSARFYTSISNALAAGTTQAGDTLYIRSGTYPERMDSNQVTIPSGTSWSAPVTIAGFPGETVTLTGSGGNNMLALLHSTIQYLIVENLHFNGINLTRSLNSLSVVGIGWSQQPVSHIILQNCELYNGPWNGITSGNGSDVHLVNLDVHDNGWDAEELGYESGNNGAYLSFANSEVVGGSYYRNTSFGVRVYDSASAVDAHDNVVTGVRAYLNGYGGIVVGDNRNLVYNNVIYDNGQRDRNGNLCSCPTFASSQAIAINRDGGISDGNKIFNNTIYGYRINGISINAASEGGPVPTNSQVRNNIIYNGIGTASSQIGNSGTGTIISHNLCQFSHANCAVVGNPNVTNAGASDFTLLFSSPAIDAGTNLSATFTTDFDGNTRVVPWDIGAYEFGGDNTPPAAPTGVTVT